MGIESQDHNSPLSVAFERLNQLHNYKCPLSLWEYLCDNFGVRTTNGRNITYLSGSLTSSGARRIARVVEQGLVYQENEKIMRFLSDAIARQYPGILLFLPSALGKIPGWKQFEYNFFWVIFISGLHKGIARQLYSQAMNVLNIDLINNPKAEVSNRRTEYMRMIDFVASVKADRDIRPIISLIQSPDADVSLGGQMERRLAEVLEIPVYALVINTAHADTALGFEKTSLPAISNTVGVNPPVVLTHTEPDYSVLLGIPSADGVQTYLGPIAAPILGGISR